MRFKIVSVGWNCAEFLTSTLESIEAQTLDNYDVMIVDDASEDLRQIERIKAWCDARGDQWGYQFNDHHKYVVRNQIEAIAVLNPDPEDVIVWLDLDGDRLAHPQVLERLTEVYENDGVLVTYGNYEPYPMPVPNTCPVCDPFPPDVVQNRTYRQEILSGYCHFNHLRTMKAKIFNAIPKEYFFFQGREGMQWYEGGTDYVFMTPALELADGRYKCFSETLCLYNHGNPLADNKTRPNQTTMAAVDSLRRAPLARFEEMMTATEYPIPVDRSDLFMPAEDRRHLLRLTAAKYALRNFVETGTCSGDTPFYLQDAFSVLHTIELDPGLFQQARNRFDPNGNVRLWQGDSTLMLPRVLAQLDGPALIWLDGHYSGPGTSRGEYDTPVVAELAALFADRFRHIIFIDDARIFDEGPEHDLEPHYHDYPKLSWVREVAEQHEYSYLLEDDIIRLVPKELT